MSETEIVSSASAKVILAGGKSVNYGFPALATAVEPRTYRALRPLDRDRYAEQPSFRPDLVIFTCHDSIS